MYNGAGYGTREEYQSVAKQRSEEELARLTGISAFRRTNSGQERCTTNATCVCVCVGGGVVTRDHSD